MIPAPYENISNRLATWYTRARRDLPWRRVRDPYRIWVSEVMLQQTQVKTVIPYYESFLERFPDIAALAAAKDDDVVKAWEGLGYYARARNLHKAAMQVVDHHAGRVPDEPELFARLPGVGDYICAAVQSIAFGRPLAVVDGNVRRVLSRLFEIDTPVGRASSEKSFRTHAEGILDRTHPGESNQALMELGALICRPTSPDCGVCPLSGQCGAYASSRQSSFPVRERRKPVPQHHIAVGVVKRDDRVLITQRKKSGLLGGLWEFPGGKVQDGESPEAACVREIKEEVNLTVRVDGFIGRVRHAYTHFKVEVDVYRCRYNGGDIVLDGPIDFRWIALEEIEDYAFPKANHKFIPLLKDAADK